MKKNFTIVMLLLLALPVFAERVQPDKARTVASTFIKYDANGNLKSMKSTGFDLTDVSASTSFENFYVFNYDCGFVIIAADDRVHPVLAYSSEYTFNTENLPDNISGWLRDYDDEIRETVAERTAATDEVRMEWQALLNGRPLTPKSRSSVSPLVQTHWDQGYPYNNLCPYNSEGTAITGCVATAMAQVMKYWENPYKGTGSHSYSPSGYGTISANFGNTVYDWDNMPNIANGSSSAAQQQAVATLMLHCGVAVEMEYGANGSSAYSSDVPTALLNYFSYSSTMNYLYKSDYSTESWTQMLKDELNAMRPIFYDGHGSGGGHAFICDGYDENDYFHFNWGWSGYCDGYYRIGELNPGPGGAGSGSTGSYNSYNAAIFNLKPNASISAPNVTARAEGNDVTVEWTASAGASFYKVYRNNELIANNVTQLSYVDHDLQYGSYSYHVKAVSAQGVVSPCSIRAKVNVVYPGPVPRNFAATLNGTNVNLSWTAPDQTEATLQYGTGGFTGYSYGYSGNYDTYWAHRYPSSLLSQHPGTAVHDVEVYFSNLGNYTLYICKGNDVQITEALSQTQVNVTSTGWNDIVLSTPVPIDYFEDLWIVLMAPSSIPYPAAFCYYSSTGYEDASYISTELYSDWYTHSDSYISWMINTNVSDGTYTYNIYRENQRIAQNLTQLHYTDSNLAEGVYRYWATTNYSCGESDASDDASVAIGAGMCHVQVSALPQNGGTVSGGGDFQPGETVTVSASANEGYEFVSWTEYGNVVSSLPEFSFNVNYNRNLVANFAGGPCTVVFELLDDYGDGWNGNQIQLVYSDGTPSESLTFNSGTYAMFQREIAKGTTVTVNFVQGSYSYECSLNIAYDNGEFIYENSNNMTSGVLTTFTVDCGGLCHVLVSASPENGGTVSGGGDFQPGETVTVSASANEGYEFVSWTEYGNVVSSLPEFSFNVNYNRNLVANFAGGPCTVVFELLDDYGDGWNGNQIQLVYSDGTPSESLTFNSGTYAMFQREIAKGTTVTVKFVTGSYSYECSLNISYDNGEMIYYSNNMTSGVLTTFIVDCETAQVNDLYCLSTEVSPENAGIVLVNKEQKYYDDGIYSNAIGLTGGGSFEWGIMIPKHSLNIGYVVGSVSLYDYIAFSGKVSVYQGGNTAPESLIYETEFSCYGTKEMVDIPLPDMPVVNPNKHLWIVLSNYDGDYVAAICADSGDANGRWICLDGETWEDMANYGHNFTWMIRANLSVDNTCFEPGTEVTVEAVPNFGYHFSNWTQGPLEGWTTIDADADGYEWTNSSVLLNVGYGYNGSDYCVMSQSYDNSFGVLYPDNYLVSPKIQVNSDTRITFMACALDSWYPYEHFGVAVSMNGNTNPSDFTTIAEWTLESESKDQSPWREYSVDLSAYSGNDCYVAIRHFNCSNQFYLMVDNIQLQNTGPDAENRTYCFDMASVSNENTYTFTMDGDKALIANFEPNLYEITTIANPAEGGVTSGDGLYYYNTYAELHATPNENYVFTSWTIDGEAISFYPDIYSLVDKDIQYSGNFTKSGIDGQMVVGTASGSVYQCPTDTYWCNSLTQQIFMPEEIGSTGLLESIGFYYVGNVAEATSRNVKIYLKNTDVTEFSANNDWIALNESDLFFDGEMQIPGNADWVTIDLDRTFSYDGTHNLMVCMIDATGSWTQRAYRFSAFETTSNRNKSVNSNYDVYSIEDMSLFAGENYTYINCMKLNFRSAAGYQTQDMFEGWNWWSSYIEMNQQEGLSMLEEALGNAAATIKSQSAFIAYENGEWAGTLSSVSNSRGYMIQMNTDLEFILSGNIVRPEDNPVDLHQGWNWIGYPTSQTMDLEEALASLTPAEGDVIKNQNAFATYSDGNWVGTMTTMIPGSAYLYNSQSEEVKVITFSQVSGGSRPIDENEETNWKWNQHRFADNISIIAMSSDNGADEIGAFVDGECRGSVKTMEVGAARIAFLTVSGNDGDEIVFRRYSDGAYAEERMTFHANDIVGTVRQPFELHFGATGIAEGNAAMLKMFPNPADGMVTVSCEGMRAITLTDVFGQELYRMETEAESVQLNLSGYAAGLYLLNVSTGSGMITKRLTVVR